MGEMAESVEPASSRAAGSVDRTYRLLQAALFSLRAGLGTGLAVGLANGLVYVVGRVPHPFTVTLASLSICARVGPMGGERHAYLRHARQGRHRDALLRGEGKKVPKNVDTGTGIVAR